MLSIAIVTFQVGVEFPIDGLKCDLNMGQKDIWRSSETMLNWDWAFT